MTWTSESILSLVLGIAVVLSIINILVIGERFGKVNEAQAITRELMRPATLDLVTLVNPSCQDCFNVTPLLSQLKQMNVNITSEKILSFDSPEGQALMEEYAIQKLPAFVVSGEVNKTAQLADYFSSHGQLVDVNHGVYTAVPPPYFDVAAKKVVGRVSLIHVEEASCEKCKGLNQIDLVLKQAGVGVARVESYDYSSSPGKDLIARYGITRVPALLISQDIEAYPAFVQQLKQAGVNLKDDYYVMHTQLPPYRDLTQDKVVGLATLIMLKDESCITCYDVAINRNILERFGLVIATQETYDLATTSAKALLEKYKITKVPTILVSSDASLYPAFVGVWSSVGSVESDGWYVMRKPDVLGTYTDLIIHKTISPQAQAPSEGEGAVPPS